MLGAMDKRVSEEVRAPEQPLEIPKGFFFSPLGASSHVLTALRTQL